MQDTDAQENESERECQSNGVLVICSFHIHLHFLPLLWSLWHERIRDRSVVRRTELLDQGSRRRPLREPGRVRWTEYGRVESSVAVVISRGRNVSDSPERERKEREV